MIEIVPTDMTNKGYRYTVDKEIKMGEIVELFGQTFLINKRKRNIYIGISNYRGAGKNNKTGSRTIGEHNLIFISPDEVWRTPVGKRGGINV
jgi:hypothetical protein